MPALAIALSHKTRRSNTDTEVVTYLRKKYPDGTPSFEKLKKDTYFSQFIRKEKI